MSEDQTGKFPASMAPSSMAQGASQMQGDQPKAAMTAPGSESAVTRPDLLHALQEPQEAAEGNGVPDPVPINYPPRAGEHAEVTLDGYNPGRPEWKDASGLRTFRGKG